MMTRHVVASALALTALFACSKPAPPPAPAPAAPPPKRLAMGLDVPPDTVDVELDTADGPIVLELDRQGRADHHGQFPALCRQS